MLGPADKIVPADLPQVELETPMRPPPFTLEPAPLFIAQRQRSPVIDGRQPSSELPLAPAFQLFGSLVARIEPAERFQLLGSGGIAVEPPRLMLDPVWFDAKPSKILEDRCNEFFARALDIRVIIAEDEGAVVLP